MNRRIAAFLRGLRFSSAIYPTHVPIYRGWAGLAHERGDWGALAADWDKVGGDLTRALNRAHRELESGGPSVPQKGGAAREI